MQVWPAPRYASLERPWIDKWHAALVARGAVADVTAETRLTRLLPPMGNAAPQPAPCNRTGVRSHDWLLCGLPAPPCLVLSIGIGGEWDFEEAAAARGCEVHAFDPTVALHALHRRQWSHVEKRHPGRVHFHYIG